MIPDFDSDGLLPPGLHWATWQELSDRFGTNAHRMLLLSGMRQALEALKAAGCNTVYIDGSFVTSKDTPGDFDACWDPTNVDPHRLDPVLLIFEPGRKIQKAKYGGELFISTMRNGNPGPVMLDFFQNDKNTGRRKGIVAIDLRRFA
ncbi:DUF6932 family protein [Dehalococcoides mccartyi]|uniref:Uncharacterized protein n=1 Tax=Dehalococcoides mccartyi TaxID=61435 RepID=A0A142V855_9CHLR|nr:hypothetical protein [Dehalococcoides mccartyi]AMU86004.1 hypothetical protein Dm11a5_0173 [Dehalococcoides mccartyi]